MLVGDVADVDLVGGKNVFKVFDFGAHLFLFGDEVLLLFGGGLAKLLDCAHPGILVGNQAGKLLQFGSCIFLLKIRKESLEIGVW